MDRRLYGILIAVTLAGVYFYSYLQPKGGSKQNSSLVESISLSNPVNLSKDVAIVHKPEATSKTDTVPVRALSDQMAYVQKVARFVDAYDQCRGNVRCDVAGDPWKEYLTIKEEDRGGVKALAILNYLMSHLDKPSYRESAKKIILDSFGEGTQLYYWYLGDFYHSTGERRLAKETYDQYRKKYADKPEFVNWTSVGNFYYNTGDLVTALECYQNELSVAGRREGVREAATKESFNFLEDRIIEIKKRLNR